MFSLTQMQELWHLYFKRSTARKRIAANEESIGKLQQRALEGERWREDFEKRFDEYKAQQVELAIKVDKNLKTIEKRAQVENDEARRQYRVNDLRDENNKEKFADFDQDFDDVFARLDETDRNIEEKNSRVHSVLEEKFGVVTNQAAASDRHFNMQVEKLNREIERLKFDLTDLIDQRQETMDRMFQTELLTIKQRYNESIGNVDTATGKLETLFQDKMIKIKTKIAKFFAKTDMNVSESNK